MNGITTNNGRVHYSVNTKLPSTLDSGELVDRPGLLKLKQNADNGPKIYRAHQIDRNKGTRILALVAGLAKDFFFKLSITLKALFNPKKYSNRIEILVNGTRKVCPEGSGLAMQTEALVVNIHGLTSNNHMHSKLRRLQEAYDQGHMFAYLQPNVKNKGLCSLKDGGAEIYEEITRWIRENENKPILLAGSSNGARIAAYLATKLREDGYKNPIHVTAVVGPFKGTTIIDQPDFKLGKRMQRLWQKGIRKIAKDDAYQELKWDSEVSQDLRSRMARATHTTGVISHFRFIRALDDTQVLDADMKPGEQRTLENSAHPVKGMNLNVCTYDSIAAGHIHAPVTTAKTTVYEQMKFFEANRMQRDS